MDQFDGFDPHGNGMPDPAELERRIEMLKTFEKKTGYKNLAEHDGEIYINPMDFRRLYEKGSFQASVFVDDTKNAEGMKDMLERGGYHVLVLRDHIYNFLNKDLLSVIQLPVAVILCIAVFYITSLIKDIKSTC